MRFFEKVQVTQYDEMPSLVGQYGLILGLSQERGKPSNWGVWFESLDKILYLETSQLSFTDDVVDSAQYYKKGNTVKVVPISD
ncbi:MAG: hypothetical protein ACFBZ9_18245 [Sphingomonadales bacterium]